MCGNFFRYWRPVSLTFNLFNWKLALHLLVHWGMFLPILIFYVFLFSCYKPVRDRWTNRQTDGRTDGREDARARRVIRSVGRPHNDRITTSIGHVTDDVTWPDDVIMVASWLFFEMLLSQLSLSTERSNFTQNLRPMSTIKLICSLSPKGAWWGSRDQNCKFGIPYYLQIR